MSESPSEVLGLVPRQAAPATTYEERYGLAERPFGLSPDVRFAYSTESYGEALHDTVQALQRREGVVVITGEAGTGKTLLCRLLLQQFDERTRLSVVLDPYVTFEDLLRHVLSDFGVLHGGASAHSGLSRQRLLEMVQEFLSSLIPINAYAVIVIDEAQDLAPTVLEQFRLLSNFETDEAKLLQIVLVGQPDLNDVLRRPELQRIQQRVARRCELPALSPYETARYIERRLSISWKLGAAGRGDSAPLPEAGSEFGDERVRFTPAAIRAVSAFSGGNPRAINLLCDRALELGHEHTAFTIDRRLVRLARRRMDRKPAVGIPHVPLAARIAVAILMIGVPSAWFFASHGSQWLLASAETLPAAIRPAAQVEKISLGGAQVAAIGDSYLDSTGSSVAAGLPWLPTDMLPVGGGVAVGVDSLRDDVRASGLAARLNAMGLPAFVRSQGGVHRILVGPYLSRSEAEDAQAILATHGFLRTVMVNGSNGLGTPGPDLSAHDHAPAGGDGTDIVLLASGDRTSVVLEMTGEPRQAMVRRVGDSVLEVDAGPVTMPLQTRRVRAPMGTSFFDGMTITGVRGSGGERFVRARLNVPSLTQATVRVAGHRVYVDLMPSSTGGAAPVEAGPPVDAVVAASSPIKPTEIKLEKTKPESGGTPRSNAYRQSIDAALERFDEIEPFLLSAIASPQADVLAAVARTLEALGTSVRASDVPAEAKEAHELLTSAVAQVGRAVEPTFTGDRQAEALRAIAQFAEVKRRLKGES